MFFVFLLEDEAARDRGRFPLLLRKSIVGRSSESAFFAISSFSQICLALEKAKVGAASQDFLVFIDMMLGP